MDEIIKDIRDNGLRKPLFALESCTCKYCGKVADVLPDGEVQCWECSSFYCYKDKCGKCGEPLYNGQWCVKHRKRGQCGC